MGFKTCFVFLLSPAVNIEAEHNCRRLRFLIILFFAFLEVEFMDHKE